MVSLMRQQFMSLSVDPKRLVLGLLLLAAAFVNTARIVQNTRYTYGAGDLYVYWYVGQFVRQQTNPYEIIDAPRTPDLPLVFLDGKRATRMPAPWTGLGIPTLAAPLVWLFSLFSFFSWDIVKLSWMATNFALALAIPHLLLRILPGGRKWPLAEKILLSILFLALGAVRSTGGNGQTSLFVFFMMLATLRWSPRHPLPAGILFGVALSKYSLSLSLLPILAFQRRWRVLATAFSIQFFAALALALWSRIPLRFILSAYLQTLLRHAPVQGIHLSAALPGPVGFLLTTVVTIAIPILLAARWKNLGKQKQVILRGRQELMLLTILTLWLLLIAYHGRYDAVIVLLFYALLHAQSRVPSGGQHALRPRARMLLSGFTAISLVPMIMPITFSQTYPPVPTIGWSIIYPALFSLTLLGMLIAMLWLLNASFLDSPIDQ